MSVPSNRVRHHGSTPPRKQCTPGASWGLGGIVAPPGQFRAGFSEQEPKNDFLASMCAKWFLTFPRKCNRGPASEHYRRWKALKTGSVRVGRPRRTRRGGQTISIPRVDGLSDPVGMGVCARGPRRSPILSRTIQRVALIVAASPIGQVRDGVHFERRREPCTHIIDCLVPVGCAAPWFWTFSRTAAS